MNILYVFADTESEWNCSEWRCVMPHNAINLLEGSSADMVGITQWVQPDEKILKACEKADVHFIQRLALGQSMAWIEEWKSKGKTVVVDVDDCYHYMPKTARAYPFWIEGKVKIEEERGKPPREGQMLVPGIEQLEWGIRIVHAVTSPSKLILNDWKPHNKHGFLIPNYIDTERYLIFKKSHASKRQYSNDIHIGWGGSYSHFDSWQKSHITQALREISEEDRRIVIHVAGDKRIPDMINTEKRLVYHNWTHPTDWPRTLSQFDIGVIPLSGRYDKRRSWIKALEYTLMGIPWIGTKGPSYEPLEEYGTLIHNSYQNWKKGLWDIIENYDEYKAKVDAGFEFAMAQDVKTNAQNMIDTYAEIANLYN